MTRWRILTLILMATLLAGGFTPATAQTPAAKAAKAAKKKKRAARPDPTPAPVAPAAIRVAPYLQNPSADAISIYWQTNVPCASWLEWGETRELGQKQYLTVDGLRQAGTTNFHVRLSGLTAGKTYYYRAAYQGIDLFLPYKVIYQTTRTTPVYAFTLPDPAKAAIQCLFFNDLHNNYPAFAALAPQIQKQTPDLVFLNGDCYADPASEDKVTSALQIYNKALDGASRPILMVRGNHETRGAAARDLKRHFEYPDGKYYFAFDFGPVHFTVLDSGEDKLDDHQEYYGLNDFAAYRQVETEWLRQELQSEAFKKAKYRVLVHHIPLYAGAGASGALTRPLWEPLLKDAPIDVAISGHTHRPQIIQKAEVGNPYPVVIGGGPGNTLITLQADAAGLKVEMFDRAGRSMGIVESGK